MARAKKAKIPHPLQFPAEAHQRVHGPRGHTKYGAYKPWLRDEFEFRCVYCLTRERWADDGFSSFSIDHVKPKSKHARLTTSYENLVYSCQRCNTLKSDTISLLDPCQTSLKGHLRLTRTGRFEALTLEGRRLIEQLQLNADARVAQRSVSLYFFETQDRHPDAVLRARFGYPEDLPDLAKLNPPKGNTRPDGVKASHRARQIAGHLPPYQ